MAWAHEMALGSLHVIILDESMIFLEGSGKTQCFTMVCLLRYCFTSTEAEWRWKEMDARPYISASLQQEILVSPRLAYWPGYSQRANYATTDLGGCGSGVAAGLDLSLLYKVVAKVVPGAG